MASFLQESAKTDVAARKMGAVLRASGINQRYSVLDDFFENSSNSLFNGHNPKVEERMAAYQNHALPLALQAINQLDFNPDHITHLITVSCTGMMAPGIEVQLAQKLDLPQSCARHAINFVGCHGAFHALKLADQFVHANRKAKVLIVAVELCSLHFQPSDSDDSILANALFGDGAAACIVSGEKTSGSNILLDQFSQHLFPSSSDMMAWNIHSDGFLLKLSSYVPDILNDGLNEVFTEKDTNDSDLWAIHPGGKNILEAVAKSQNLDFDQMRPSETVLSEVGNLSSATILFVLKELLRNATHGQNLNALGFGPGLTVERFKGKIVR